MLPVTKANQSVSRANTCSERCRPRASVTLSRLSWNSAASVSRVTFADLCHAVVRDLV